MTTREEIETRLQRAVAVDPTEAGLRWLDQRVAQLAARSVAMPRQRGFRTFLRPLALVAALMLLAGAVAAGTGLLDRIFESSGMPGWRLAWDRAERLGLKQTDAGITITLERAYADRNQFLVGVTVAGLEPAPTSGHGESAPIEWKAELRDPAGRTSDQWAATRAGSDIADTNLSAIVHVWEGAVTPMAGTWVLTFSSIGYNGGGFVSGECTTGNTDPACVNPPANAMIDGTWRFEFELPAPAGMVLSPNVSVTQGEGTLTLTQLRITPTMVTSRIALRVAGGSVVEWQPTISIRRGDTPYVTNASYHITQDPNTQGPEGDLNEFLTTAGADTASGTWVIEIPELTYRSSESGPETRLVGPWTLTVTVP